MSGDVSARLAQFVGHHIPSVEHLEILLLLAQDKDRSWTARTVSQELRSNMESAARRLATLEAQGLLVAVAAGGAEPAYRYEPRSRELAEIVTELAQTYTDRRYRIIELIFSRPLRSLEAFADAFRVRKDDKNG